ncbi:hypothetical protein HDU76_011825 [Blyttiomyces sp. JEL0837]|nr:hypothetical protein HDU76_011825 [Blyttiomyces sp. JEL0837]
MLISTGTLSIVKATEIAISKNETLISDTAIMANNRHPKTQNLILSEENTDKFPSWKSHLFVTIRQITIPEGYTKAMTADDHIMTTIAKPAATDGDGKETRGWIQTEAQVEGIILAHLNEKYKALFFNAVKTANPTVKQRWDAFVSRLKFDAGHRQKVLTEELSNTKQNKDETKLEFGGRIQDIMSELQSIGKEMDDTLAFEKFMLGLQMENHKILRRAFQTANIKTFSAAMDDLRLEAKETEILLLHHSQSLPSKSSSC